MVWGTVVHFPVPESLFQNTAQPVAFLLLHQLLRSNSSFVGSSLPPYPLHFGRPSELIWEALFYTSLPAPTPASQPANLSSVQDSSVRSCQPSAQNLPAAYNLSQRRQSPPYGSQKLSGYILFPCILNSFTPPFPLLHLHQFPCSLNMTGVFLLQGYASLSSWPRMFFPHLSSRVTPSSPSDVYSNVTFFIKM